MPGTTPAILGTSTTFHGHTATERVDGVISETSFRMAGAGPPISSAPTIGRVTGAGKVVAHKYTFEHPLKDAGVAGGSAGLTGVSGGPPSFFTPVHVIVRLGVF